MLYLELRANVDIVLMTSVCVYETKSKSQRRLNQIVLLRAIEKLSGLPEPLPFSEL